MKIDQLECILEEIIHENGERSKADYCYPQILVPEERQERDKARFSTRSDMKIWDGNSGMR